MDILMLVWAITMLEEKSNKFYIVNQYKIYFLMEVSNYPMAIINNNMDCIEIFLDKE